MSQETKNYQYERNDFNTYGVRGSASGGTEVVANPEGEATADLAKLKVDDTIYELPEGTIVVGNPTLAGTEGALTGLQVGDTKYKVDSGMANPMTALGDMIYGGNSGTPTRLAKGTAGQVLKVNEWGTNFAWGNETIKSIGNTNSYIPSSVINYVTSAAGNDQALAAGYLQFTTTAPSANNTNGYLKIVVLTSEPATYYDGYYYIIAPST